MKKGTIWLKNFAAGYKALGKRILVYGASALAAHEIVDSVINQPYIYEKLTQTPFCANYVFPVLDSVLLYLGLAVVLALIMQFTFSSYSKKIKDTDATIELKIGDIFTCEGEVIVPSNNLFTNSSRIINTGSIQHQLSERALTKPYAGSEPVEKQIADTLASDSFRSTFPPVGKQTLMGCEYDVYPLGTLLPVKLRKRRSVRTFHLVAMSEFISEGKPTVSPKQLLTSIDNMWFNIKRNKIEGDTLVVPVIGTGSAKMTAKPMHIVAKYILRSFADNAGELGIKKLVLCIYPGDYINDRLDMDDLRTYVDYVCCYPESEFRFD